MEKIIANKVFIDIRKQLKKENKKIILCHGVFDLIHPGHISHFQEAKSLGDILVVSITAEKYVRKGPGRPYFNDELRMKFLAAIECIDYVILSDNYTVDDIIETVEPDLYVKGREYVKSEDDITGMISVEAELVRKHGGEMYYTSGDVFSSTKLINTALSGVTDEVKRFISELKMLVSFDEVKQYILAMQNLKVLVIGDVIIDEYVFCNVQGLMSKDMAYSARYTKSEQYLGGALAIARHIAEFSNNVTFMSAMGNESEIHSRILNELSSKMRLDLQCSDIFETIIKKRYVTQNEKREDVDKIFVINNLPTPPIIDEQILSDLKRKLQDKIGEYDLVVLGDFGHGLVDPEMIEIIETKAKCLALNCQTNSSNVGVNLITKYHRADIFTLDQKELKLAIPNPNLSEEEALQQLVLHLHATEGILTKGSKGATGAKKELAEEIDKTVHCPALTLKIKDTIGAGDALFSMAALCFGVTAPLEMTVFMGNIAGALAANIVGNEEGIEKVNMLKYASTLINI